MLHPSFPNPAVLDEQTRILELEERIQAQGLRIASLELRLRRDEHFSKSELSRHEEAIESLKSEVFRLKEESAGRHGAQAELSSLFGRIEAREAEEVKVAAVATERQLRVDALSHDLAELKGRLIEEGVLAARTLSPGADPFDGLISDLTRECGGNVADRGLVGITAKSVLDDGRIPRHVADLRSPRIFNSKNEADQWIEWDFKTSQIIATHYSIFTHGGESGTSHLRNWVLEGRNGDEDWIVLDERRDDSQLNGRDRLVIFNIATRMRVRLIRLRQTGVNHQGNQMLVFRSLEFFGELIKTPVLAGDVRALKSVLIENGALPERICSPGADPLDGLISHLTRECGGNVVDRGLVGITAKSVWDDTFVPQNAADLRSPRTFGSKDEADQWIQWDFKTSQIVATHYSIHTHSDGSGASHLRNWVLEGRNEDEDWIVLDERRDDSQLNGKSRLVTFDIATRIRVRLIRLRQTGVNHRGSRVLSFRSLEFFGRFFRPFPAK
jgi:hypothetical protein